MNKNETKDSKDKEKETSKPYVPKPEDLPTAGAEIFKKKKASLILGAIKVRGKPMFVVKWTDSTVDVVAGPVVREEIPQHLINFYEKNVKWTEDRYANAQLNSHRT